MDRRIKYTKKVIKDSLITLLNEKEINKITVSEICKLADINRATFYRYYLDAYDLLDKIKEELVSELVDASQRPDTEKSVYNFAKGLLVVLENNKKLAKILFNNKSNIYFLNEILEIAYNRCKKRWLDNLADLDEKDADYASVFIFNGALGAVNYWVQNDFDMTIDEISHIIEDLSYYGVRTFIYKK